MSERDDGGQAFPTTCEEGPRGAPRIGSKGGMSLRDWFAGMALSGGLTHHQEDGCKQYPAEAAADAYKIADAMLKERAK